MQKNMSCLTWLVGLIAFALFSLVAPPQAQAGDIFDDIAYVLDEMGSANPYASQGLTGGTIRGSKQLFACIADGGDVLVCIQQHKDTEVGQRMTENGVPGWFWDFIDVYIAWKEGSFTGVIEHLGPAAACLVMQFISGGVDLCGLITEVIDLAKNAAAVIGATFKALAGAVEDICCATLCNCDPPEPSQAEKAWRDYFRAEVENKNGLLKKHQGGNFWRNYLSDLENKAAKEHGAPAAAVAAGKFEDAVNLQWDEYIIKTIYPQLLAGRNDYETPETINKLANLVMPPNNCQVYAGKAETACIGDLSAYGTVSHWVTENSFDALNLGIVGTPDWCRSFIIDLKDQIAPLARDYVRDDLGCYNPFGPGTYMCPDLTKYRCCEKVLAYTGEQNSCAMNIGQEGKELAEKIVSEFKAKGSATDYQIIAPSQLMSSEPTQLICQRPTQQSRCNTYNPYDAPKMVDCVLQEDAAYKAIRAEVVSAVTALQGSSPYHVLGGTFKISPVDPLLVMAPTKDLFLQMQAENKAYGFGHFIYNLLPAQFAHQIDGLSTPLMTYDTGASRIKAKLNQPVQKELDLQNPVDPISQKFQVAGEITRQGMTLNQRTALAPQAMAAAAANAGESAAPMQAMSHQQSGSLPGYRKPVTLTQTGTAGPVTVQPRLKVAPAPRPDLQAEARLRVAGQAVQWGATATIRDDLGACDALLNYTLLNSGGSASGPFMVQWTGPPGSRPISKAALAPGAKRPETQSLKLSAGLNRLTLVLDPANGVAESNEDNNRYTLSIRVDGACGKTLQPAATLKPAPTLQPSSTLQPAPVRPSSTPLPMKLLPAR